MNTFKNNKILIATGGTGGHIFPAYSLAKNIIRNNFKVEIVTDKRGFKFLQGHKDLKIIINNSATIFNKKFINFILSIFVIFSSYIKSLIILFLYIKFISRFNSVNEFSSLSKKITFDIS